MSQKHIYLLNLLPDKVMRQSRKNYQTGAYLFRE